MIGAFSTGSFNEWLGASKVYLLLGLVVIIAICVVITDWRIHGSKKLGMHAIEIADIHPDAPKFALLARIGIFCACIVSMSFIAGLPEFTKYHSFSKKEVGYALATYFICSNIGFFTLSRWKRWQFHFGWQWGFQLLIPLGVGIAVGAALGFNWAVYTGLGLLGFGCTAAYFFSIFYTLSTPDAHAQKGGLHEGILSLGNLLGPWIAGALVRLGDNYQIIEQGRIDGWALGITAAVAMAASLTIQGRLMVSLRRLS